MRRDVALVELHTLDGFEFETHRVALFNRDDAVFADLVDGIGDDLTNGRVSGRDRCHSGDRVLVLDVLCLTLDRVDGGGDGCFDAAFETHRVGASGDVAQPFTDESLRQDGCGGRAVTSDIVGLGGDFLDQLRTHVFHGVFQLDLFGDRDTIVGDGGRTVGLVENDVASTGADRHFDRIGEGVDARLERPTGRFIETKNLGHWYVSLCSFEVSG